jgi:hypothetical protein
VPAGRSVSPTGGKHSDLQAPPHAALFLHAGVAFPASMSQEAGPPPLRRAGVPRLLVVWLYRQYLKFFPVPVFLGAILVPKEIECFNPLISKGLLKTLNFMEEEKVPFF